MTQDARRPQFEPGTEPWLFRLPDLHEFPEGHPPGPYVLMSPARRLPSPARLVGVGWLDGPNEFATGATEPDVIAKLLGLDSSFLIDEGTRGFHECYYCGEEVFNSRGHGFDARPGSPTSKGHHLVQLDSVVYMFPALLPHYIVTHDYRPPAVFDDAVRRGKFLRDSDLIHTGEDFVEVALRLA